MITTAIAISFITFFALGLPDGILGVAWPGIRSTFSLPVGAISALLVASSIGYFTCSTSIGMLLRRFPLGSILTGGAVAMALGAALFGAAPVWAVLLFAYVLIGSGAALIDAGLNAYAAEHFSATAMNWMHAFFGIGATVGPSVVAASAFLYGSWRPAYLFGAIIFTLNALLLYSQRRHVRISNPQSPDGEQLSSLADTERKPPPFILWGGVLTFFLYTGVEVTTGQLSYTLLTEGRNVDPVQAGFWVSVYWLALTGGRILQGPVSQRLGVHRVLRMSFVLAIVAATIFALGIHPLTDGLALGLLGFALAPVFPLLTLLTPERVGLRHSRKVIGWQMGAATMGVVVLAGGGGVLAGSLGLFVVGPYILVLAVACGGLYSLIQSRSHCNNCH